MVELKTIDWDNFWKVIEISPNQSQKEFLHFVSVFMAQSYINLKQNNPDVSLAIYAGKILIGFTKIVYLPKKEKPYYLAENAYMIDALIIDKAYQGRGYGKQSLDKILNYIKTFPFGEVKKIALTTYDKNTLAINLFKDRGFKKLKPKNKLKGLYIYTKEI